MIHALEIENFKGFAARQRFEFAPLTLLFGANSAGKSTILHALLYLHELLERGSADVDRTELGGQVIELGGFARLVHRHEIHRAIVLRVEFATPVSLERFGRDVRDFPFPDLDDEVEKVWLEVTIRHRTEAGFRGALLEEAVLGIAGQTEPLVWLGAGATLREDEPLQARINLGHPLLAEKAQDVAEDWEKIAVPEEVARHARVGKKVDEDGGVTEYGANLGDGSGFGDGRSLPIFIVSRTRVSALPPVGEPLRVIPFGDSTEETMAIAAQVRTFLEMVVLGTTAHLIAMLRNALYIGPLRTIPPRGFLYERPGRVASWADGLAAWDVLLADRGDLVERTNAWLRKLRAGCQVVVQQLFDRGVDAEDIAAGHVDKTVRRLLLDTGMGSLVLPSEVGAGISQVMPIVVAALEGRGGVSLMEQPEIHVHPGLQVELGDLFIEATREGGRSALLVETHAEHVILRLLRRIRETTENELVEGAPSFAPDKLSVLYVERTSDGVRVRRLRVDPHGEFTDRWPKGFFEERAEELF